MVTVLTFPWDEGMRWSIKVTNHKAINVQSLAITSTITLKFSSLSDFHKFYIRCCTKQQQIISVQLVTLTFSAIFSHPTRHAFFVSITIACIVAEISTSCFTEFGAVESIVMCIATHSYAILYMSIGTISADRMPIIGWIKKSGVDFVIN